MWQKTRELAGVTIQIFKHAGKQYGVDRVNRMSAAVAYRAIFATAPLLLIAVYIVGLVIGGSIEARAEILAAINRVAGPTVYDAVETLLDELASTGSATGLVGLVLLLWTGSSLFLELQNDLNDIFGVPYEETAGILETVRKRGLGFLWALGLGLILVLILLVNSIWQFVGDLFPASFEPAHNLISALTPIVSALVLPLVFAVFTQTLTQVTVRWRAVWWGSLFTSIAFLLTSYGASLYFRFSSGTAAGIAGALFVILLLAYVFSAVFLFGAEVTRSYELYLDTGHPPGAPLEGGQPAAVVAQPEPAMPVAAIFGFLSGLFVGWWRRR